LKRKLITLGIRKKLRVVRGKRLRWLSRMFKVSHESNPTPRKFYRNSLKIHAVHKLQQQQSPNLRHNFPPNSLLRSLFLFADAFKSFFMFIFTTVNLNYHHFSVIFADYHGINGNVSLDRRSEFVQSPNRYDMTFGSDKSSASRNGTTTYDVVEAERNNQQNIINNNTMVSSPTSIGSTQTNGNNGTLERNGDAFKKKWPTDKAYFLSKEILMTERTYRRDLDVINSVSYGSIVVKQASHFSCFTFSAIPQNARTRRR
jgi:hypothetical protein